MGHLRAKRTASGAVPCMRNEACGRPPQGKKSYIEGYGPRIFSAQRPGSRHWPVRNRNRPISPSVCKKAELRDRLVTNIKIWVVFRVVSIGPRSDEGHLNRLLRAGIACVASLPAIAGMQQFPANIHEESIRTDGATIYVRLGGRGPSVLMLHGFGDTRDI